MMMYSLCVRPEESQHLWSIGQRMANPLTLMIALTSGKIFKLQYSKAMLIFILCFLLTRHTIINNTMGFQPGQPHTVEF